MLSTLRKIVLSIFFPVILMAQEGVVQYDSVSVYLSGAEQDSIIVSFRDKSLHTVYMDTTGITSKLNKPGDRVYVPDEFFVIVDTVQEVSSADSSALMWVPLSPVTKVPVLADSSWLIGTGTVATATLADGRIFTLPLKGYAGDYALICRQDDLTVPRVRWKFTFVWKTKK